MGLAVKPLGLAVKQLGLTVKQLGPAALSLSSRNLSALTAGARELLTLFISVKQKAIRTQIFSPSRKLKMEQKQTCTTLPQGYKAQYGIRVSCHLQGLEGPLLVQFLKINNKNKTKETNNTKKKNLVQITATTEHTTVEKST
jgi:hypothetical protein